ncbi:flavin reductase family protein [Variovorax sp. PBL-E5]|uniref:flavin reductase family protein n=1 Tax=Variovorax sp. PBL-E5 TaxID=434014 RepID=UPI001316A1BB|nr:flavin reductase family protein [Variovorax sp. PBL-E5]VTU45974.1 FMN reductase (NADH) NtaB [Variovorax sp. PBL-E5]
MNAMPILAPCPPLPQGLFATGRVLISLRGDNGRPRATQALAFNSVSLTPAIVVWVLGKDEELHFSLDQACGVSVLAGRQPPSLLHWQPGEELGAPLATDSLASFEAVVFDRIDCGDEVVHFAQLASFRRGTGETGDVALRGQVHGCRAL